MIYGLGTDLVDVERIAEKIERAKGFKELIFSAAEIDYCDAMTHRFEHYAARFAAKEAFFKALGTGWLSGTAFNQIQIMHNANGKPQLALSAQTKATITAIGEFNIHVSLSHTKTMATATVILETR